MEAVAAEEVVAAKRTVCKAPVVTPIVVNTLQISAANASTDVVIRNPQTTTSEDTEENQIKTDI